MEVPDVRDALGDDGPELSRRRLLAGLGGVGLTLGGARALDNVVIGYGVLVGENLHTQPLASVVSQGLLFGPRRVRADGHRLVYRDGTLSVHSGGTRRARLEVADTATAEAAALDAELGLSSGPLEEVVRDLRDLQGAGTADPAPFEFDEYGATLERARNAEVRPYTTGLLRGGSTGVDPDSVAAFVEADPADPEAVIKGLVGAFREETYYDIPRYTAGSVQDNVIAGALDLREFFRTDVDYEALVEADSKVGLFCYEFTHRSAEALHAAHPRDQTPPVAAAPTWDTRHKHVYTAVTSAVREREGAGDGGGDGPGRLVLPTAFVDYTHTTLYHDLGLTGVLGEGLEAYDERHRASNVRWWH